VKVRNKRRGGKRRKGGKSRRVGKPPGFSRFRFSSSLFLCILIEGVHKLLIDSGSDSPLIF
jgi:hypothetical protein